MKQLIFALLLLLSLPAQSEVMNNLNIYVPDGEAEEADSKFDEFISGIDLNHFTDSVEIDFTDWKACGNNVFGIPGIAGCYDEPVMMADYSKEPLQIQSLGISLSKNPQKSGYTRKSNEGMFAFGHVNIITFPFLGMIMDSKWLCLVEGDVALSYLSAFDPMYDGMFAKMLFADINIFFKPELMLLGFIDCAAATVDNYTSGLSSIGQANDKLRMSFPHYFGCWNTFPMGGWSQNADPIVSGGTATSFALSSIMKVGMLKKSIRIKGLDGKLLPDTMCGPKISPQAFIKPQFFFQLIYPTKSRVVPLGASAPEWAEFKNKPNSVDNSAFWIWKRKCLYFGAAACGN